MSSNSLIKTIKKNYQLLWSDITDRWRKKPVFQSIIFDSKVILIFITLSLMLILKGPMDSILEALLEKGLFDDIHFDYSIDLIFVIIGLGIILVILLRAKDFYRLSFKQCYFIGTPLVLFTYYRIDEHWDYVKFHAGLLDHFAYLDVLFLLYLYPVFFILLFHFLPYKTFGDEKYLVEDIPIEDFGDDQLGRSDLAKSIAKKISNQKFIRSFSMGVLGPWGAGKSSFMRLIEKEIASTNSKTVQIHFNASFNKDAKDIIKEFFTVLSNSFRPYSGSLSNKFSEYRDYLLKTIEGLGTRLLSEAYYLLSNEKPESILDQYTEINNELSRLGRQLVVFIDDVDRLRTKEIIQILKLLRNTGDFSNTVYIVSFDKDYVIESLKKHTEFSSQTFLQKYFQYEFVLPLFDKTILKERFTTLITDKLDKRSVTNINKVLFSEDFFESNIFEDHIHTLRDVTRLANAFLMDYMNVQGEVDPSDFIDLMILKTKHVNVFQMLGENPSKYLSGSHTHTIDGNSAYVLKREENNGLLIISDLQRKHPKGQDDKGQDVEDIKSILTALFEGSISSSTPSFLSIRNPRNIQTYFKFQLLSGNISEVDFIKSFSSNFEVFKNQLDIWIENGQQLQVIRRMQAQSIDNKSELLNAIDGLFYIAVHSTDSFSISSVIDVLGKTLDFRMLIEQKNIIDSRTEVGEYVLKEHLSNPDPPYLFQSRVIRTLFESKEETNLWDLPEDELKTIQESYFDKYLSSIEATDWDLYRLYHYTFDLGISTINESFQEFLVNKDYKQFLSDIIDKDVFEETYEISTIVEKIFGSYESFGDFLSKLKSSKELEEFKKFYELNSFYNFKTKIYFDFSSIKLRDYQGRKSPIPSPKTELYLRIQEEDHSFFNSQKEDLEYKYPPLRLQTSLPGDPSIIVIRDFEETDRTEFVKQVNGLIGLFIHTNHPNLMSKLKKFEWNQNRGSLLKVKNESMIDVVWFQVKKN